MPAWYMNPVVISGIISAISGKGGGGGGDASTSIWQSFLQSGAKSAGGALGDRLFRKNQGGAPEMRMTPAGQFERLGPESVSRLRTGRSTAETSLMNNPILLSMLLGR